MKINGENSDLVITQHGQALVEGSIADEIAFNSLNNGESYGIQAESSIAAAKVVAIHIKNTSDTHDLIINNISVHTVAEAATTPAVGIFWTVGVDRTYASGGANATVKNTNSDSGKSAAVTAKTTSPTLGGTDVELHRYYPKTDGEMYPIPIAKGAIVVGPSGNAEVSYTSTGTAGRAAANLFFSMKKR